MLHFVDVEDIFLFYDLKII